MEPKFGSTVHGFCLKITNHSKWMPKKNEFLKLMSGLCNTKASKSRNDKTKSRVKSAHAHYAVAGVLL